MPSDSIEQSQEALNVAVQYLRRECPVNGLVVIDISDPECRGSEELD